MGKHAEAEPAFLSRWREYRDLTLIEAAERIALAGEAKGYKRSSKKVPGTHPSLWRVENGVAPYNSVSLALMAEVYQCSVVDLLTVDPTLRAPKRA